MKRHSRPSPEEIGIYVRVSTEDQAKGENSSPTNQRHRCRQRLLADGYTEEEVSRLRYFSDEGLSGKDMKRPQLQHLLREIRAGRIKLIMFTEISRISRSVRDFLTLTEMLGDHGCSFISLKENFDTSTPHGQLVMVILIALAEFERQTTSARTKAACLDRAERGLFNGGRVPLGYRPDPDRSGYLLQVPEEAAAVRDAFDLYLELGSISAVAKELDRRGYRRQARTTRRGTVRPSAPIKANALTHMLKNPVYVGLKVANGKNKDLPPEDELSLPDRERFRVIPTDKWEPIVDEDVFERVGELLEENRRRCSNAIQLKDYDYVLQGTVQCEVCCTFLEGASSKRQQYHYYRHPQGTKQSDCPRSSWAAEAVEALVLGRIAQLSESPSLIEALVTEANKRTDDLSPQKQADLVAAKAAVSRLQEQHESWVAKLMEATGTVPASFWDKAQELEADLNSARAGVRKIEQEIESLKLRHIDPEIYRLALGRFREAYEGMNPVDQANLLRYLIADLRVGEAGISIALLGELPEEGDLGGLSGGYLQPLKWLPLLDSNQ